MSLLTIPSVQAQNNFGTLIDTAQREIVSITRRGRSAALIMSPQVLEDYIEGRLAMDAEAEGLMSEDETSAFLSRIRNG